MTSKLTAKKASIEATRHNISRVADHFLNPNACGTMIPSGSYIGALLQLEGSKEEQLMVLSDVMETLSITVKDLIAYRREASL